jgi:hypothetical protein
MSILIIEYLTNENLQQIRENIDKIQYEYIFIEDIQIDLKDGFQIPINCKKLIFCPFYNNII